MAELTRESPESAVSCDKILASAAAGLSKVCSMEGVYAVMRYKQGLITGA